VRLRTLLGCTLGLSACTAHVIPRSTAPAPAATDIVASVILIGDAGAPNASGEPVLQAVQRSLAGRPDSTVILFLGDNVYPLGIPDSGDRAFPDALRRLQAQVDLSRDAAAVFVPGNHDWDKSGSEGLLRIRRQGALIAALGEGRARMVPSDGCPGPDVVDVTSGLRLVLLDTEWWLFSHEKPGPGSACPTHTEAEIVAALERVLQASAGRQVIVAGHHPLLSAGPHGGYFSLSDHIFPFRAINKALYIPLPVIGSLYPVLRGGTGLIPEDLNSGRYLRLRAALDTAFACRPPALYAAGHEHTLQLLDRGRPPLLAVSGVGIAGHQSHVERIPETRLALSQGGFMRADLLRDGRLRLGVLTATRHGEPQEVFAELLVPADRWSGGCVGP